MGEEGCHAYGPSSPTKRLIRLLSKASRKVMPSEISPKHLNLPHRIIRRMCRQRLLAAPLRISGERSEGRSAMTQGTIGPERSKRQ